MNRNGIKKDKAQMELNLEGNVKSSRRGFYRYSSQKRLTKECVPPSDKKKRKMAATGMEKAEVLKLFASVFTGIQASQILHASNTLGRSWGKYKAKCQVMHFSQDNPKYVYRLKEELLESSPTEKVFLVLVNEKLDVNQQYTLASQKANGMLCCIKTEVASRKREVISPPL